MTYCWHWSRSFLWCPLLLCRPVGQLPASTRTVSIKHKEQRYKKSRRKEWNAPLGTLVFLIQLGPELHKHTRPRTHTHTVTHGRRLTAPSGSCAAEGRMKGNTKTTTRERQVASLAGPHAYAHTLWHQHTHTYTCVHKLLPSQTPCCAHLWKCQILDSTSFSSPALFLPSFSLFSTMNLSPPFSPSDSSSV